MPAVGFYDRGETIIHAGKTKGQIVTAGEALGVCAEQIDAEASLGPHLHLEALRAGVPVDVMELLGESEAE